jgi:hypothetical protein
MARAKDYFGRGVEADNCMWRVCGRDCSPTGVRLAKGGDFCGGTADWKGIGDIDVCGGVASLHPGVNFGREEIPEAPKLVGEHPP